MADANGQEAPEPAFGRVLSILRGVCEIADDVDILAARRPQDAPAISKKQKAKCLVCPHNPSRLFPNMNTVLLEDVTEFHAAFKERVSMLAKFDPPNKTCLDCASKTVADFEGLYLKFEEFVRKALNGELGPVDPTQVEVVEMLVKAQRKK